MFASASNRATSSSAIYFSTLHSRSAYEDHEEPGLRRHLFPIWLSDPNSHPPHPLFKNNYDATEAGALVEG